MADPSALAGSVPESISEYGFSCSTTGSTDQSRLKSFSRARVSLQKKDLPRKESTRNFAASGASLGRSFNDMSMC